MLAGRGAWRGRRAMPAKEEEDEEGDEAEQESCVFGYNELPYGVGLFDRVNCDCGIHIDRVQPLARCSQTFFFIRGSAQGGLVGPLVLLIGWWVLWVCVRVCVCSGWMQAGASVKDLCRLCLSGLFVSLPLPCLPPVCSHNFSLLLPAAFPPLAKYDISRKGRGILHYRRLDDQVTSG